MHQGAHGAQVGILHGVRPRTIASGGVRIKLELYSLPAEGGLRVRMPEPKWGGASVKQEPEQPPLLADYKVESKPDDPEDEPSFLRML
jgi:hypothetical protein